MSRLQSASAFFLIVMMGTWLTSCVYDEVPEVDVKKEYGICLSLITASESRSRATGITDEVGSANENRIDIAGGDFRVLLFAGSDDNAKLVAMPEFNIRIAADDYTEYMVWTKLPASFFRNNGINPDQTQDYQLMVIANWESLGASYPGLVAGTTTVSDVKTHSGRLMSGLSPSTWRPFEGSNKGIPMYGLLKFSKRQSDMAMNIGNDGEFTPNVNKLYLLRALAKIEITDNTKELHGGEYADENEIPWIEGVKLSSYNANGDAVPSAFVNGSQVTAPTLPDNLGNTANLALANGSDKKYSAYLMEQSMQDLKVTFTAKRKVRDGETYKVEEKTFERNLSDIITQEGYKEAVLRNHIYRISVAVDHNLDVVIKVIPQTWEKAFDNNFNFQGE